MTALGFSGERRNMSVGSGLRRVAVRMHWFAHYFVVLFPLASCVVSVVESNTKYSIHWNASNEIFSSSNNLHVININYQDTIDIICPQYDESTPESERKYYKVYSVSQNEYNDCTIYDPRGSNTKLVATCKKPLKETIWTLWITEFQSVPRAPSFRRGGTYYFISTSTGTLATIDNQLGGACSEDRMKIILNVCCASTGPVSTSVTDCITCSTKTESPNVPTTASTQRSTSTRAPSTRPTPAPDTPSTRSTRSPNDIPTEIDENKEKYRPKVTDNTEINADGLGPKNMGLINGSSETIHPSSIVLLLLILLAVTLS